MASISRQHGVWSLTIAAIAAVVVAAGVLRVASPVGAAFVPDPYSVTQVVDTNPDPNIVETTITARPAAVDIGGGVLASVLTFNGTVPGPEFRLKVGDTVIVHFQNNVAHATGIHWHGIELNNASDGTPLTQNQVAPGGSFLYKFKVVRPGIYWYHPHHHSSTNQVFKGLYGAIIVTDPNEAALQAAGTLPSAVHTRTMVLGDMTVCKAVGSNDARTYSPTLPHVSGGPLAEQASPWPAELCETSPIDEDGNPRAAFAAGDVPNIQKSGTAGRVNEGQTVLTNGVNVGARAGTPAAPGALAPGASVIDVQAGQGMRLQFVNASTVRFFRLRLTTSMGALVPLVRVGGQGGLLDNAAIEGGVVGGFDFKYDTGEILLDPGDRADVVAAIPPDATGVLTLWTEDVQRTGGGYADTPTVPVAHFNVSGSAGTGYAIADGTPLRAATGDPVEALGAATATLLNPAAFTPAKAGLASQNITLTQQGPVNTALGINGVIGSHDVSGDYTTAAHPGSARYAANVPLGSTLELMVTNQTGAHHPFHLHGFSIQPLDLTKAASPTYTFPYKEFRDNIDVPDGYTLRFRVRLDDRTMMDGTTAGGSLGRWVVHCHIFFHAVFGMISEFNVVAATGNERPYVNADTTLVQGTATRVLAATGRFFDRDGDAVALTASSGTIVNDVGTHWTWTRTGGASGLVYVTATDSQGLRDQVAFETIVNQAPVVTASAATGPRGTAIAIHGAAADPENAALTTAWMFMKGAGLDPSATCVFGNAAALDTTITCTHPGAYTIAVTASDGDNTPVTAAAVLTVTACSIAIAPASLPAAVAGRAFSAHLSATGATGTPAFALAGGSTLPPGLTLSSAGVLSGIPLALGRTPFTVSVSDDSACGAQQTYSFDVNPMHRVTTGAGAGPPEVRWFDFSGAPATPTSVAAFDSAFGGGVRVAAADLTGDSVADTIVAQGPGGSLVRVLDGATGAIVREFAAYPWHPDDGVYVAAGDVTADGVPEIITGAGGSPPLVRVFDARSGVMLREFLADLPSTTAGVRVAAGDVNGDGGADIITSFGPGAPPIVRVFGGDGSLRRSFLAYADAFTGGVFVAAGDVNGDGYADVVTGAGPGGGPHVRVWNGRDGAELMGFFAYAPAFTGGVRVAAGDVNGDGRADIITGAGPGGGPHVRVFDGATAAELGGFFAYPPMFTGGVFVASPTPLNRMAVDAPAAGGTVAGAFRIVGWALVEAAPATTAGVGQIHAWAYPAAGGPPFFLGFAAPGDPRPDVAAVFGGQFGASGFHIDVAGVPTGTYDVVVFVFDGRTGTVTNVRVVRTTVQ